MRMLASMAGDAELYAHRIAEHEDVRVAIEFTDHDILLTFHVMQTGEVCMSAGPRTHGSTMWHLGNVVEHPSSSPAATFQYNPKRIIDPTEDPLNAADFPTQKLRVVPD